MMVSCPILNIVTAFLSVFYFLVTPLYANTTPFIITKNKFQKTISEISNLENEISNLEDEINILDDEISSLKNEIQNPSMLLAFTQQPSVLLLELYCQGEKSDHIIYALLDENQQLWVKEEIFKQCPLPFPKTQSKIYQNQLYILLDNKDGMIYHYNSSDLTLNIQRPYELPIQNIDLNQPTLKNVPPERAGIYLNYDLSVQGNTYFHQNYYAGFTDFVYFNRYGVGDANFLYQDDEESQDFIRLCTTWTIDKPEELATWRFGDSVTRPTMYSGSVQFGGIQYATNFATAPGFVTFPLPSVEGDAIIPTTVDFFLENQLRSSIPIKNGPYSIQGIPVITGAGEVVVQTHDLLGRHTVAILPYYISQQLLKPDLSDYSYEIGFIRQNFGLNSYDYSRFLMVGSYQKGITADWTGGVHAELLSHQQTLGFDSSIILGNIAQFNVASAASICENKFGGLFLAGIQRITPHYSFQIQSIFANKAFKQIGIPENRLAPATIFQSNASCIKKFGTFSLSYTQRVGRTEPNIGVGTLSFNKTLFNNFFYLMSYVSQMSGGTNHCGFLSLVWAPKPDYTASLSYENNSQQDGAILSLSKNLPTDNGYGYRILATTLDKPNWEVDFSAQSQYGLVQALFSQALGYHNYEFDLSGSILHFADQLLFTRKIGDSFVLVQVPTFSDIPIYKSNQIIGNTNANGYFLIPETLPYDDNIISINPVDFPLTTLIDIDRINASPYYRSGVMLTFPVARVYNILFKLVTPSKEPLPSGAIITLDQGTNYPVGYDGKVFMTENNQTKSISGIVQWENNQCQFYAPLTESQEPIMELGNITCIPLH